MKYGTIKFCPKCGYLEELTVLESKCNHEFYNVPFVLKNALHSIRLAGYVANVHTTKYTDKHASIGIYNESNRSECRMLVHLIYGLLEKGYIDRDKFDEDKSNVLIKKQETDRYTVVQLNPEYLVKETIQAYMLTTFSIVYSDEDFIIKFHRDAFIDKDNYTKFAWYSKHIDFILGSINYGKRYLLTTKVIMKGDI